MQYSTIERNCWRFGAYWNLCRMFIIDMMGSLASSVKVVVQRLGHVFSHSMMSRDWCSLVSSVKVVVWRLGHVLSHSMM